MGVFASVANADTGTSHPTTASSSVSTSAVARGAVHAPIPTQNTQTAPEATTAPALQRYGTPQRETLGLQPAQDPANALLDRCISDQAGPATSVTAGQPLTRAASPAEAARADAIERYCAPLVPKPAWELDRANPDGLAFAEAVVARLKAEGVTEVALASDEGDGRIGFAFGGASNDAKSIQLGMQLLPAVELAVAGR
ncbi:hypothetical protein OG218_08270 [Kineococcus sp. NBC_00420]|uniref:hypothetical protein n=1 Tax=Kineococcus sp. NBC_00420 TaxID=2903564 RepID=UPI002E242515